MSVTVRELIDFVEASGHDPDEVGVAVGGFEGEATVARGKVWVPKYATSFSLRQNAATNGGPVVLVVHQLPIHSSKK